MTDSHELEVLRRAVGEPPPAADRRVVARTRLDAAIAAELAAGRRPRSRRSLLLALGSTLLVLVGAAVYLAVWSSAPVSALQVLAQAARQVDPLDVPPGAFVYTTSERIDLGSLPGGNLPGIDDELVGYLLPTSIESWRRDDGFVQLVTTIHRPVFFDPMVEEAYYRAGLDRVDRVGDTGSETFADVGGAFAGIVWPTDPDQLLSLMEELIPQGEGQPPREVRLLNLAATLLRGTVIEPDLRAMVLEVLASLELEVDAEDESLIVAVTYQDWARTRYSVTFDDRGNVVAESTILIDGADMPYIPAGTVVSHALYTPPVIVPDLLPPAP